MTRILFQIALFLSPFVAYAVWLHFAGHGWRAPERWRGIPLVWLVGIALALTLGSLATLALTTGGSTKALYMPARMENGVFVPGRMIEPDTK